MFTDALRVRGHEVSDIGDVLLSDHDAPGPGYDAAFAQHERAFLYPHAAGPLLLTLYPRRPETRGLFVVASGQQWLMQQYGESLPTRVVGWPFGPTLPYRQSEGRRVLYTPGHADGFGWLPPFIAEEQEVVHQELAAMFHVELRVRTVGPPSESGLTPVAGVEYVSGGPPAEDVEWADVVVSAPGSFPSFSCALGCPTVVISEHHQAQEKHPVTQEVVFNDHHLDLLPSFAFPLEGDSLVEQIRSACDHDVACDWRRRFIGDEMDSEQFVVQFEQAVEAW